jgi:hypothetical protein
MPVANEPFYCKLPRMDGPFEEGQYFDFKSQLKTKLASFHLEHNMKLNVENSNKNIYIVRYKDLNYP